ncbi:molybdate ABC transporter substrate-binding protein [Curtobacterium sp. ISL-83]|uniref:molybdate ABC transporter substrate-binding protein n=1 Tax=Curtobacterium sp. ISL-83 TaxID=2819145 RepID=UPI001BE8756C|nr:molybdate ABC transporter substrate-binding protein [Curtobacterium sp. ISL-83]MBT2501571.1 molybdate ABC transporter substrate-binding protein [Curtobacterium sp. ISL-83]
MTRLRFPVAILAGLAAAALLAGCAATGPDTAGARATGSGSDGASATGTTTAPAGSITVFAAASLQRTFTELGKRYEQTHPGTTITFSFAGSSDLATQIRNGAPADVFAAADETTMQGLVGSDVAAGAPRDFASNVLEIAVAPGNPEHIATLADLTRPGLQVVTCAAPVPCGAATGRVERIAGVDLRPVSEEQSVTDVLGKVSSGQADAGLVYATDVRGAGGKVDGVTFPAASRAVNTYPVTVLRRAANPALASAFTAYVRSDVGQRVLAAAGFGKP